MSNISQSRQATQQEAIDALEEAISNMSPSAGSVADRIDAKVSKAGTSASDVADGTEVYHDRWSIGYDGGLAVSSPAVIADNGSGAVPNYIPGQTIFTSGVDGDWGSIAVPVALVQQNSLQKHGLQNVAAVMIQAVVGEEVTQANLGDKPYVGFIRYNSTPDPTANNDVAAFDFKGGQIIVDDSGTQTTTSITYPDITRWNEFTVIIANENISALDIGADQVGFWINANPFDGAPTTATVNDKPSLDVSDRSMAIGFESGGNDDRFSATYLRAGVRT